MQYLLLSFLAGILTVFSPCIFTLLPVILGGSLTTDKWKRVIIIITSLGMSVFLFTLLLKASTLLINIDPITWKLISGFIIIIFGFFTIFPEVWDKLSVKLSFGNNSQKLLEYGNKKGGNIGSILIGASLGPIFTSCSPTYTLIIATILPQRPAIGILYLLVYIAGLIFVLAIVATLGQKFIRKTKWAANPNGRFKKTLGIILLVTGILIVSGLDKKFESFILENGYFDITKIEFTLLKDEMKTEDNVRLNVSNPYSAPEIEGINAWINSSPLELSDLKGKVVIIDFWTYSCINCIRTIPHINDWYSKYKEDGLVIIGVHAPEFAFEKIESNVKDAVNDFGIKYPVALDNDFSTWKAYDNHYWPASYFIDKNGKVVHTHFGEGEYEENERIIQQLLGINTGVEEDTSQVPISNRQSPETYLGYNRFSNFLNIAEFEPDTDVDYTLKESNRNSWSLSGKWEIKPEFILSKQDGDVLQFTFNAKNVYLVMGAEDEANVKIEIFKGDELISSQNIIVNDYKLYTLADLPEFKIDHTIKITLPANLQMNAFTFGS